MGSMHPNTRKIEIVKELGISVNDDSTILDLGCGQGQSVRELRELGYQAFGCDFKLGATPETQAMREAGQLRRIEPGPYRLPFEDSSFDFIFSHTVLEHVRNYDKTINEIRRVLRTGGVNLHTFPSKYRLVEAHIKVPFASLIRSYWWLYLWAVLGIRNPYQAGMRSNEVASMNLKFLRERTNYLSKKQLTRLFSNYFSEVTFCEDVFLKCSRRGRLIFSLGKVLPFLPSLYSTFRARVLLAR